jgi:hypothetical protein
MALGLDFFRGLDYWAIGRRFFAVDALSYDSIPVGTTVYDAEAHSGAHSEAHSGAEVRGEPTLSEAWGD